jgi:hypothetical protein
MVRMRVFENSDPSEQVGMVRSDGADRHFHLICEGGGSADKHGPLRPRFSLRAVNSGLCQEGRLVDRPFSGTVACIPAAVTGGPERCRSSRHDEVRPPISMRCDTRNRLNRWAVPST